jgi:hydroxymethylpyrimidine pyrophosphatase-like HAD family hydrolase
MSEYQALVFDLDGTAVPNRVGGMPSPRLIRTVAAHKDRLHLIAATGRSLAAALPVIEALQLTAPCITSGGTIIYDPTARRTLRHTVLPRPALVALIELTASHPYHLYLRDERFNGEPAHTLAEMLKSPTS